MTVRLTSVALFAVAVPLLLAGCRVSDHKDGKGGDNVDISTPFASMHVKTNDEAKTSGIGLTVYPGAVPVKEKGNDSDAADINMSFGDFHLGVKAASYQTADSPDKVEAFYRKDMAKYGEVLKCMHDSTVGQPTRTSQGLTCNDDDKKNKNHVHTSDDNHPELRAGSPTHQHIVGIEPKNGGTKIGLVMLDLPKGVDHDDKQTE